MWYSAALLFERRHPDAKTTSNRPLYEESIRIVEADCDEDARLKAEEIGKRAAVDYPAISGEKVEWRFVDVLDIHEILDASLSNGTEVFSRFLLEYPKKNQSKR